MIKVNDIEIKTVEGSISWSGAKDIVSRDFSFNFLFTPQDPNFPVYQVKVGDKVEWIEDDKTLFYGYVVSTDYSTDGDIVSVKCNDLLVRLQTSKTVGRFNGTLTELCDKICGLFGLQNGIKSDSKHVHNIVSDGDMTYFEIINTACKSVFDRYALILDGVTLKVVSQEVTKTFEIGKNIRKSHFSSSVEQMITKVLIIDSEGNLKGSVQDDENLKKFGLFQDVYNYDKDCKNNIDEARKVLKGVENKGDLVCDNDNEIVSGSFIKIFEPINNFVGIFEVKTDSHSIDGVDNNMSLEVDYVKQG